MKYAKRHYEDMAQALHRAVPKGQYTEPAARAAAYDMWLGIRNELATLFAGDNPNFDRDRFEKACGS